MFHSADCLIVALQEVFGGIVHNSKTVASSVPRFELLWFLFAGWDSSIIIATPYRLDSLGVESYWGRDFSHTSRLALGPIWPPV